MVLGDAIRTASPGPRPRRDGPRRSARTNRCPARRQGITARHPSTIQNTEVPADDLAHGWQLGVAGARVAEVNYRTFVRAVSVRPRRGDHGLAGVLPALARQEPIAPCGAAMGRRTWTLVASFPPWPRWSTTSPTVHNRRPFSARRLRSDSGRRISLTARVILERSTLNHAARTERGDRSTTTESEELCRVGAAAEPWRFGSAQA